MVSSIALVLGLGKLSTAIYNTIQSKRKPSSEATNTFEKRNVCRKTAMAYAWESGSYFVIAIIAIILGM